MPTVGSRGNIYLSLSIHRDAEYGGRAMADGLGTEGIGGRQGSEQSVGVWQSLYDGIISGDYSDNNSAMKNGAQIGAGFIPILGQVADARDTAAAIAGVRAGRGFAWENLALSLVGWLPLAGDAIKAVRRSGLQRTVAAIGDSLSAAKDTWRVVSRYSEEKLGEFGALFYKPSINFKARGLPAGTYGVTNRWGDIDISRKLDGETAKSTLDHESVHAFFSPKFKYGQEIRANIGVLGYAESHLLRRVEEGLAESWARWKAEGISGLAKGWRFPLENPYDINPDRVRIERNIILGSMATSAGAGAALADGVRGRDEIRN